MHKAEATDVPKKVVTKAYDPLFFDDLDGYLTHFDVDKHDTHEVHTCSVLAVLQGSLIPKNYGSF